MLHWKQRHRIESTAHGSTITHTTHLPIWLQVAPSCAVRHTSFFSLFLFCILFVRAAKHIASYINAEWHAHTHTPHHHTHTKSITLVNVSSDVTSLRRIYIFFFFLLFRLLSALPLCCCSSRARPPPCHQRCHFGEEKKASCRHTHKSNRKYTNEFHIFFLLLLIFRFSVLGSFVCLMRDDATCHSLHALRWEHDASRSDVELGVVLHGAWRTPAQRRYNVASKFRWI